MSSDDTPVCPVCGGTLKYRDTRLRIRKKEGGVKEYLMIRRLRCTECHRHHNELPDCLVPHKHYEAEVISGVLDGIVTSEDADSEDSPSLLTMLRWLQWFRMNLANIEGFLRNAGYRILGLGEELLFSHASLLDTIRQHIRTGWSVSSVSSTTAAAFYLLYHGDAIAPVLIRLSPDQQV